MKVYKWLFAAITIALCLTGCNADQEDYSISSANIKLIGDYQAEVTTDQHIALVSSTLYNHDGRTYHQNPASWYIAFRGQEILVIANPQQTFRGWPVSPPSWLSLPHIGDKDWVDTNRTIGVTRVRDNAVLVSWTDRTYAKLADANKGTV